MGSLMHRTLVTLALAAGWCAAYADQGAIRLSSFPAMSVADGRSTVTVTAEIRLSNGRPVQDGTQVIFNTTLGSFRENVVTTNNGYARAVLVSGPTPGTAKITASALVADAAPATLEFEFVRDRNALSTAREYIELIASGNMQYTPDNRIIGASGLNGGVSVRYRELLITADDIQLNTQTYELRARKAKFKLGKETKTFDELYLRLNQRRGFGTTTFQMARPVQYSFNLHSITGLGEDANGKLEVAKQEERYGMVEVRSDHVEPLTSKSGAYLFKFEDLGESPSTIMARKAVVFPMRQIQFQQADIVVAGRSVMRMPLYQLNLQQASSPLVTEQFVNVNDSQVAVNYPYFLSLKPGLSSLFRFRTGESYGRGLNVNRGAFLDYELNWNKGDDFDGGLSVNGIGRDDWGVSLRQYQRIDDRSTLSAQLDLPQGSGIMGSASVGRQFDGFQANVNTNLTRNFRGLTYTSQDSSVIVEKDPTKIGNLPAKLYYGITATSSYNSLIGQSQSTAGIRVRALTNPLPLSKTAVLNASVSVSHLSGAATSDGMTYGANLNLSQQVSKNLTVMMSYDFTRDGFNDSVIGQHRVSFQSFFNLGRITSNTFISKSIDVDRANVFGDLSYTFSKQWRFGYQYTYDRLASNEFLDYTYVLGYRIGWREVGLTWSRRTNRIGFQLLGASLY